MIHKPIHTLQIKGKELKRNNFLRLLPKSFHNFIKDQHSIYLKKKKQKSSTGCINLDCNPMRVHTTFSKETRE